MPLKGVRYRVIKGKKGKPNIRLAWRGSKVVEAKKVPKASKK